MTKLINKFTFFAWVLFTLSSCVFNQGHMTLTAPSRALPSTQMSVSKVAFINNQLVITGTRLTNVQNIKIEKTNFKETFSIVSQTETKIIANSLRAIQIALDGAFNLVLSNAHATSTFVVDFSICNATLNGKGFDCSVTAQDKDILAFDSATGKWKPKAFDLSGLTYMGSFDATGGGDPTATPTTGEYWIIQAAGFIGATHYNIGDWVVTNASHTFDRVSTVGVHNTGDYNLSQLGDIDFSTTPTNKQALVYNGVKWAPLDFKLGKLSDVDLTSNLASGKGLIYDGAKWVPGDVTSTPTAGSITNTELATSSVNSANIIDGTIVDADISATAAIAQSKISGLTASLAAKEGTITNPNDTTKYYRGDKTFQTLNTTAVTEGTNLYFTTSRAVNALKGADFGGLATITGIADPVAPRDIVPLSYLNSSISSLATSANLTTLTTTVAGKLPLAGGTLTGDLTVNTKVLLKDSSTNYVTIKANTTTTPYNFILPGTAGTSGQVLSTDGAGNLSWTSSAGQSITAGTGLTGGTITTTGTVAVDVGTTANKILQLNGSAQIPAVDGSLLTNINPSNLSGAVTVAKGGTGLNAGTSGGIPYYSASNAMTASGVLGANGIMIGGGAGAAPSTLATGTSGYILTSAGTSAPTWTQTLPVANGGTGATTASGARTNLGLTIGSLATNIPVLGGSGIVASNICAGDGAGGITCNAGITSATLAGSMADETGSGALVFATNPAIPNITPGADFTLTQNAVVPFTSVNTGAVVNTLVLKTGFVGIGTNAPTTALDVNGTYTQRGIAAPAKSVAGQGSIYFDSTSNTFKVSQNNGNYVDLVGATGVQSLLTPGTTGTAPSWSQAGTAFTLEIPMAATAGVTAGLLSKTDYDIFAAKAGTASPTFTGIPLAPTAAVNTNTTQIATTAFVLAQAGTATPLIDGVAAVGTATLFAREDHKHPTDTTRAPAAGSSSITTVGTITSGTWNGTTIAIANGGTGATDAATARSNLGLGTAAVVNTGSILAGTIPLLGTNGIVGTNLCAGDNSGGIICNTMPSSTIAGTVSDETGSGALVFATNPAIPNITPGADFTLTQNTVVPFKSVNTGAVVNTLVLKTGQVGMGTATPDADAALDISSTTKGLLIPRMTTAQRTAIASGTPTAGMQVYDTDLNSLYIYNGTAWTAVGATGVQSLLAPGTTGTAPSWSQAGNAYTLEIPMAATGGVTAGLLNKTDYDIFAAKAGTASPTFTGIPLAPTAAVNTNTTQIATTAFVLAQAGTATPLIDGVAAVGTATLFAREDHKHPIDTTRAASGANSDITSLTGLTTALSIAQGGTGATDAATARTNLGLVKGALATNIPVLGGSGIVTNNICTGDNAGGITCNTGITSATLAGSMADETGSGALVFATNPAIPNITPGADFTLTQNTVVPFTSVDTGAIANTLYLKTGFVGIGTNAPTTALDVNGAISERGMAAPAVSVAGQGRIYFDSTSNTFKVSQNNGAYVDLVGSTGVQTLPIPGTTGTAPSWSQAGTAFTLEIPMAATAGVTAGLLSKTDYDIFNAKAGTASPTFTGVPLAPTAAVNTNTTQIATTAFVLAQAGTATPLIDGVAAVGTATLFAREDHKHPTDTTRATAGANSDITSLSGLTTALSIGQGGTGSTTAADARTALGLGTAAVLNTGSIVAGTIPLLGTNGIVGSNLCSGDNTGGIICNVMPSSTIAGTVSDETGSGALVFATNPAIPNITPGADFTLTQNTVVPFTSVNTGAVANTLYLKTGFVGVGTSAPATAVDVNGAFSQRGMAAPAVSVAGQGRMYFDSTSNTFKVSQNNGAYIDLFGGSTSLTTVGTITAGVWNGTTIALANGGTGAALAPATAGGIPWFSSTTAMGVVAAGTSGSVLLSGGTGTPTWSSVLLSGGNITMPAAASSITQAAAASGDLTIATTNAHNILLSPNSTGNVTVLSTSGGMYAPAYYYNSDRRLKENIHDINGLETILGLHGVGFNWKHNGEPEIGLIAQEVEKVIPQLVKTNPETGIKSVKYGNLVAPLIEAVKQMYAMLIKTISHTEQIDRKIASESVKTQKLETEVERLKAENARLKADVEEIKKSLRKSSKK